MKSILIAVLFVVSSSVFGQSVLETPTKYSISYDTPQDIRVRVVTTIKTDGCNSYGINGNFEAQSIEGVPSYLADFFILQTFLACGPASTTESLTLKSEWTTLKKVQDLVIYLPKGFSLEFEVK